jgi:hypothetical protein
MFWCSPIKIESEKLENQIQIAENEMNDHMEAEQFENGENSIIM